MSPRLHTHTNRELRFPPLPHTSYIRDCRSVPLSRDVFSGCSPLRRLVITLDFTLLKGSGLSSRRARNQFSSLSLSTDKTPPHCHKLDDHLEFFLFSYVLPRDTQGRFRLNKLVSNSCLPSPSPVLFPCTPGYSGIQNIPRKCRVEMSFKTFRHFCTNGDFV